MSAPPYSKGNLRYQQICLPNYLENPQEHLWTHFWIQTFPWMGSTIPHLTESLYAPLTLKPTKKLSVHVKGATCWFPTFISPSDLSKIPSSLMHGTRNYLERPRCIHWNSSGTSTWTTPTSHIRPNPVVLAGKLLDSREHWYSNRSPNLSQSPSSRWKHSKLENCCTGCLASEISRPQPCHLASLQALGDAELQNLEDKWKEKRNPLQSLYPGFK